MKIKYGIESGYLLDNNYPEAPASYSNYEYEARKITEKEAQHWRDVYIALYSKGSQHIPTCEYARVIRCVHITNLIMFCGVKPTDVVRLSKYGTQDMMAYKDFELDRGDIYAFQDILRYAPITRLAELLSTMHGKQTVRSYSSNFNDKDKILEYNFECEEERNESEQN